MSRTAEHLGVSGRRRRHDDCPPMLAHECVPMYSCYRINRHTYPILYPTIECVPIDMRYGIQVQHSDYGTAHRNCVRYRLQYRRRGGGGPAGGNKAPPLVTDDTFLYGFHCAPLLRNPVHAPLTCTFAAREVQVAAPGVGEAARRRCWSRGQHRP